ncbi:MAG: hypothetical protein LBC07_00130 [Elusimicrobiota bacterium]|jgi:hypothetical protein|nr:hypothetical protein [Elusimicrobiota bacterium]
MNSQVNSNQISVDIQLKYSFTDKNKHFINAEIFNKCETKFIEGMQVINEYLDSNSLVEINIAARRKGSSESIYLFTSHSPLVVALIAAAATVFLKKFLKTYGRVIKR